MTVRAARVEDAEALWRVHVASIRRLCAGWYSRDEIEAWTARLAPGGYVAAMATHALVVAEEAGAVTGFGELDAERAEVVAVYVAPDAAGRGVGATLLARLEAMAREGGLAWLTLCASLNAEAFYARHGWRPIGRERHPVGDTVAVDCVRMEKRVAA